MGVWCLAEDKGHGGVVSCRWGCGVLQKIRVMGVWCLAVDKGVSHVMLPLPPPHATLPLPPPHASHSSFTLYSTQELTGVLQSPDLPTASYCAILDCTGEMTYAIGDMDIHDLIDVSWVGLVCWGCGMCGCV